ncbi:arginine--tRNA ligase [Acetivibrio sp. MSJd-27]|uniref:arginine--tRNA ligase n=1 Tax=Acetivibrio sp. MSJd-27 TaxID=2841523 RepID=UPI001C106DA5|nr:arginine--tRNA ligase [Acetivibrio sp. MSJd-27]MBU5450946.1 arginine--tRNA ligase [Acetivibrio sp. MSJd-27]
MKNPVKEVKLELEKIIIEAWRKAVAAGELPETEPGEIEIEMPKDKNHGDFATNFALKMSKQWKKKPREAAGILTNRMALSGGAADKVEIAGPGFINFYLSKRWLHDTVKYILKTDKDYGKVDLFSGKKVNVEFISANPTGPMHIGNARGGAIGDCLSSVLRWAGYEVTEEFYVNDAGNQIEKFGVSLNARFLQKVYGEDAVEFPEDAYHGDDIKQHVEDYIQAFGSEELKAMDEETRKKTLSDYALKRNIEKLQEDTGRYGIHYDVWFYESDLHKADAVNQVVRELTEKGYTYEKEGAVWFKSTEFGAEKDDVLIRANGFPTYFAADIAYHKNKADRGFDQMINIWGADHHGHVSRMKGVFTALGLDPDRLTIILMQLVRLYKNGEIYRVSKRSGKSVTLSDLLDDIDIDAARFFFNLRQANSHFDFDLDLAVSKSNENPVFYVQYAHARICSILRHLRDEGVSVETADGTLVNLKEQEELDLMEKLAYFPEEISQAALTLDPSKMTKYVMELASAFHTFYNACRVMCEDKALFESRIQLVQATRIVIRNCLNLLGITAPERM